MKSFGDVSTMSRVGKVTALSRFRKGSAQAATLSHRDSPFNQKFSSIAWKTGWASHSFRTHNVVRNHSMFTQAGDEKSGHLNTRSGEGIFFLDSTYFISDVGA